ncbi:sulfatase-like hydrolase/transferase [Tamlana fucoidanivorans]|uniref:T9SS type A sorting domain-containing protein n=1 Tax=Allotamlana fucoidanivorans TaxID=2583814 RepID=A0A5C4SFR8_9FLAO|nr:sulfatase-like hydrolase/transferase [Tamlana fucoidanivorans]TNJ42407.1 T9SS type A sorting domain-containing protein [Tamlana fucoidanivorans]
MRINKLKFIFLFITSIISSKQLQAQTANTKPNIIVILADDLGYGDVGFNREAGFPADLGIIPTPNLNTLADNSVICKNAHVAHPFCGPSRAALLTGMMPHRIGAQYNLPNDITSDLGVPVNETYFPKLLQDAGYNTIAVGKWHLGFEEGSYQPLDRGFHEFFGFLGGGKYYFEERYEDNFYNRLGGSNPVTNEYQDPLWRDRGYVAESEFSDAANEDYLTDVLTDQAISYINTYAPSSDPYFMYLAYNAPHTPLEAPDAEIAQFKSDNPDFEDLVRNSTYMSEANQVSDDKMEDEARASMGDAAYNALTPQEQQDAIEAARQAKIEEFTQARITYATMVTNMDKNIGRLVTELKKDMNEFNNTVIIFLSDNGGYTYSKGAVNYPLAALKGSVNEGGHKVPMFVHWPDQITSKAYYNHQLSALDIYPTLVNMAGGTIPEEKVLDGVDFMDDLIAGTDPRAGENILIMRPYNGFHNGGIANGQWKIVKTGGNGSWRLYDIENDPGETTDLRASEPNAEQIIQDILDKAVATVKEFKDVKPQWFDNDDGGAGHPHSFLWDDGTLPGYNRLFESNELLLESEISEISITGETDAIEGDVNGVFKVSLPEGILASEDIDVTYTVSGEATAGNDYTTLTGNITIASGTNSSEITIVAGDDSMEEASESVTITLQSTTVGSVNSTPASILIFDVILPTQLTAGDVAIVGYKAASGNVGELAFVILKEITAGTSLSFSNRGWNTDGSFNEGNSGPYSIDDVFSWTATDTHEAGTIFKLQRSGVVTTVIAGIETQVGNISQTFGTDGDWDLSPAGDTVLIYAGDSAMHPADNSDLWLTGLNTNGIDNGGSVQVAGWGIGGGNSFCDLPTALVGFNIDVTGGDIALNKWDKNYGVYIGGTSGTPNQVRASVYNHINWNVNEDNAYALWNSSKSVGGIDGDIILGGVTLSSKPIEKSTIGLQIYPNPTRDYITLKFSEKYTKVSVQVLSNTGQLVNEFNSQDSETNINLVSLPTGMYFFKIQADSTLIIEKVVKL